MGWTAFFGLVIVGTALLVVPGSLLLRSLGLDWPRALVFSAPVGTGVVGILAAVSGLIRIPWTWIQPIALVVVLAVILILTRSRRRPAILPSGWWQPLVLGAVGVAAFGFMFLRSFLVQVGSPEDFPLFGDAAFHLQATQLVDATMDVNPFGSLGALYDPANPPEVYYPTLWHSLTALLVPIGGLVPASNAMMLVTAVIVWPVGLAGLAWALRPQAVLSPLVVNLLATFVVIFPVVLDTAFAIYPFSLSIAILPGGLALLFFLRGSSGTAVAVGAILSWVGMVLAQPSTALLYLVAVFAVIVVWLAQAGVGWARNGYWLPVVIGAVALVASLFAAVFLVPEVGYIKNLGNFQRPSLGYRAAADQLFDGTAATTLPWDAWPWIAVLAAVGAILALRSFRGRSMVLAGVFFTLVYLAAAGPDNRLRVLTGPFYKDFQRLSVPVLMVMIILAALAISTVFEFAFARLSTAALIPALAVTSVALMVASAAVYRSEDRRITVLQRDYMALAYVPSNDVTPEPNMAELEVMESLDDLDLPSGSLVIGLPSSGIRFVSTLSDLGPFFPLDSPFSAGQRYVSAHFSDILTDPEVCQILNEYDVSAFMEVPVIEDGEEAKRYPGLVHVDTSSGFELLDQNSDVRLWKITACD